MFLAMIAAAPRIVVTCSPSAGFTGVALAAAAGAGLPVLGSPLVGGGVVLAGGFGGALTWPFTWELGRFVTFAAVVVPTVAAASVPVLDPASRCSVAALPVGWATSSPTPAARWVGL